MSEKKVLLEVEVKATNALKELAGMKIEIDNLKEAKKQENGVTEESKQKIEEYNQKLKVATTVMNSYSKEIKGNISSQYLQEGSIDQMKAKLAELTASYNRMSAVERESAKGQELQKSIAGLSNALTPLEQQLGNFHRQVGNYEIAGKNLRGELRQLTQQMAELRLKGEQNSEEYQNLVQKVGAFKKAMNGATKEMQNASDKNLKLNGLIQTVQGVTAAYGLYNSVIGLTGKESKKLNEIAQKSMLILTALNSLEQIRNTLLATSKAQKLANIVLDKIGLTLTERQTRAEAAHTAMKTAGNIATKAIAAAQWLWNAALAANPLGAIITVIALAVGAIYALTKAFGSSTKEADKNAKAERERVKAMKENADEQKKYAQDIGQSAGGLIAKYEVLRKKYTELGDNVKAKNKFIKENADTFKELGVNVHNTTQADNIFIKNTQAVINALMLRAKATATMNLLTEKYQKLIELQNKPIEYQKDTENASITNSNLQKAKAERQKQQDEINRQIKSLSTTLYNAEKASSDAFAKIGGEYKDTAKETEKETKALNKSVEELRNSAREKEKANLESEYAGMTTNFLKKQEYERKVFEMQQRFDKEDIDRELAKKEITKATYDNKIDVQKKALDKFNKEQATALQNELKKEQEAIKKSGEEEIKVLQNTAKEKIKNYQQLYEAQNGQSKESEDAIQRYAIAINEQLAQDIERIKKESADRIIKEEQEKISKKYDNDLKKYADNESEKLKIQIKEQEELIKAKKDRGADTGGDETQLRQYQIRQQVLLLNQQLANEQLSAKQRYELKKEELEKEYALYNNNADKQAEITQKLKDLDKEYSEQRINNVSEWANQVESIGGNINELLKAREESEVSDYENNNNKKKDILKERLNNGLISQKEYENQVNKLDKDTDKKKAEIARNQAKREKIMKLFQVATSTAVAVMKALETGFPASIPLMALAVATGAIQTATILSTPLPKASRGTVLRGNSHAQGGIPIEAEGGEAIINKKSTEMFLPVLSEINRIGGGREFGNFSSWNDGGYSARANLNNLETLSKIDELKETIKNMNMYVAVEDINKGQKNYAKIQDKGSY